jgi:Tripartite tricarboxylate transporter TctB family
MSSPEQAVPASSPREPEAIASLRSDFLSAIGWMGLGIAILIGSVTMDRLEKQGINPYTIPGLLPGLLGIAMTILGALLGLRSWRPHLFASAVNAAPADRGEQKRLLLVLGLCLGFGVGLVGHGLPFWLAAAIFVTVAILSLQYQSGKQYQSHKSTGERSSVRSLVKAAAIGLGAGIAITVVFQELFLVRLP